VPVIGPPYLSTIGTRSPTFWHVVRAFIVMHKFDHARYPFSKSTR